MWLVIAALILAGLVLIIAEVVFIPGTTVIGFLGLLFAIVGIIFSYSHYGNEIGFYVLLGTASAAGASLYLSFRKGAWKKFSHQSAIDSKVNEGMTSHLNPGDEGVSTSVLRPMGSVDFSGKIFEVRTNGEYIPNGMKVRIVKVQSNNILVEPIQ
ncbi:MAG TPA: NfeD family protein [Cyclobacteriaceae bacterium]